MSGHRDDSRKFLAHVLQTTGRSATGLANEIGASSTTLTRLLNNPAHKSGLAMGTIQKIEQATGVAAAPFFAKARGPPLGGSGVGEEGAPYSAESLPESWAAAVAALLRGRPNARAWTIETDVLAVAGVRAGDIAIFDASVRAESGDIVCAQIEEGLGARTVFRVYQPPNLVAAGFAVAAAGIETVDGERVRIAGVMTGLLRRRG